MGTQIWPLALPFVLASLFRSAWASAPKIFDDRDPSIQYTGQWHAGGTSYEYNGTTYVTTALESSATFTFTGTRVRVYGTRAHSGNYTTLSTYSIDGGAPGIYTDTSVNDGPARYQVLFYTSDTLSNSNHVLNIVNQGDWYILDYLLVDVPDETTPASTPTTDRATTRVSTSIFTVNPPSTKAVTQGTPSPSPLISSPTISGAEESTVINPTSSPLRSAILPTGKVESGSNLLPAQSLSSSSSVTTSAVSDPTLLASSSTQKARLGTPAIAGIVVASFLGIIALLAVLSNPVSTRQCLGDASAELTGTHPSFQTNEKGTGTVSDGLFSGNPTTHRRQHGREPPRSGLEHEGGIHPALCRTTGLADESTSSIFETQPPTYTQF
ncbi:hypothetical protein NLI96_g9004 [Meripilus lineatus]|uniref:Uncharacterized protein n=1 Tax=Meripilus lineatus TaxID=2056292 RepID=A0AAD5YDF3_9APHY|nr:hypothetical protein NLI96_g9004 [Physisporinus lineatus]